MSGTWRSSGSPGGPPEVYVLALSPPSAGDRGRAPSPREPTPIFSSLSTWVRCSPWCRRGLSVGTDPRGRFALSPRASSSWPAGSPTPSTTRCRSSSCCSRTAPRTRPRSANSARRPPHQSGRRRTPRVLSPHGASPPPDPPQSVHREAPASLPLREPSDRARSLSRPAPHPRRRTGPDLHHRGLPPARIDPHGNAGPPPLDETRTRPFRLSVEMSFSVPDLVLDPDQREALFLPFEGPLGGPVGLACVTALAIVRAHGGTVKVQSRPGAGTTLLVRLPPHPPVSNTRSGRA